MGNKNPQDWQAAAEQQRQSAEELARALRAKEVNAVRNAARRVNNACNECHMVFRD
jgi:cytochrome c556